MSEYEPTWPNPRINTILRWRLNDRNEASRQFRIEPTVVVDRKVWPI